MNLEDFLNEKNIIDLSFFNFRNAITAAYFADKDLKLLRVNNNFKFFFPVLGNVTNAYFPDVLTQLGVPGEQIDHFVSNIEEKGFVSPHFQNEAKHFFFTREERTTQTQNIGETCFLLSINPLSIVLFKYFFYTTSIFSFSKLAFPLSPNPTNQFWP